MSENQELLHSALSDFEFAEQLCTNPPGGDRGSRLWFATQYLPANLRTWLYSRIAETDGNLFAVRLAVGNLVSIR